ncbi:hypothetical protein FHP25_34265 [Vineibacter terrae]|uniref:Uncharacterized protein n=1 Tax=Vineibacter terrae TaxID=2586908 RepID=A0A5C8PAN6_9HYPH|nr:hypothetical protein FHP25_34265 [Vineibacter terrae]
MRATSPGELNGKLEAIATAFGLDWLEEAGESPIQVFWKRKDALATNEFLNFGDAIERLQSRKSAASGKTSISHYKKFA